MEKKTATIQLKSDSLIALMQGQDLHLDLPEAHIVFKSPFKGCFLTHQQIGQVHDSGVQEALKLIKEFQQLKIKKSQQLKGNWN